MTTLSNRNAKLKLLLVVFFLSLMPVSAIGSEPQKTDDTSNANNPQSESPVGDSVLNRLKKDGFSLHKDNYLLPVTWGNRAKGTEDAELKFQFSFKQQLFWKRLYFAYTQKSFWRALDGNDSRPFRETNYNPEIFYRAFETNSGLNWGGDVGVEHESNGAREPISRSWNRVYIAPTLLYKGLKAKLKLWYRLDEEVKADPYDPTGDENPDIEDFYGYGELNLSYTFTTGTRTNPWRVALMTRRNFATDKGGLQFDFSIPTKTQDFYFFGQVWTGYGETLIDYNHSLTRYGIGFSFRQ